MSWLNPLPDGSRFQSIRTLSKNERGMVVLALDRHTGEQVAIRFIQRGWDDRQHKYLLRELLIHQELSAYHHPHIVEFKEVFLTPTHLAIVTEYFEGQDLQEFLSAEGGKLPEAFSRFLFQQLVLVLDFCHQRNKVCRSIKLSSTLLHLAPGQLPLVKLSDFGYSKDIGVQSPPRSQVGTALFVPPEVMYNFNNQPYDGAAVDVWAAGVVLFILLFGRHPFLRPEDTTRSERDQMLALFTRTAASQFCLIPEEALSITPGCADLLGHILQTKPKKRYTIRQIVAHPWFQQCLPEGATAMNSTIMAALSTKPLQFRQPPELIAELVRCGQVWDSSILAQQITPQLAAALRPPPSGEIAEAATTSALTSLPPPATACISPAAVATAELVVTTQSPSGGVSAAGTAAQQQQQLPGIIWGAPPPVRALAHSSSSNDKERGLQCSVQEQQQQQQQQQQHGVQPPIALTTHESTSSTANPYVASGQQQQQHQSYQQQQQQAYQQQQQPAAAAVNLQHHQQYLSEGVQQHLWQPQQRAAVSENSSGLTAGAAPAAAPAATASGTLSVSAAAAGAASLTAASGDVTATSLQSASVTNHMTALQLRQPQQQQQQDAAANDQAATVYLNGDAEGLRHMTSADLEALFSLDSMPDLSAAAAAAAASSGMQARITGANGRLASDLFASIASLQHIPSNLPEIRLDSLLGIASNPALPQQEEEQQGDNRTDTAAAAAQPTEDAPAGRGAVESPQQPSGHQWPSESNGAAADETAAGETPAGKSADGSSPTAEAVVSPETSEVHPGDIEIPEDFAAFLVDEEDLAIVRGANGESARLRRKRVLSNAGGGISSLNLRQLSDMLLDGTASEQQLLEGSLFHRACSEWGLRDRSLLHLSGDQYDSAEGPLADGDLELAQSLQGLRDMSITRGVITRDKRADQ